MIYGTPSIITDGLILHLDSINPKSLPYIPTINYADPSENIGSWNLQNGIVSGNTTTAPDGTLTADLYIPSTGNTQHRGFIVKTIPHPFSFSIYAKPAGYNFLSLGLGGGVAGQTIIFNLTGGTVSGSASNFTPYIEQVNDGWYRCGITYQLTGSPILISYLFVVRNNNSIQDYAGDGVSGMYIWGAQLEVGGRITPYVKALSSNGLRNTWSSLIGVNNVTIPEPQTYNGLGFINPSTANNALKLNTPIILSANSQWTLSMIFISNQTTPSAVYFTLGGSFPSATDSWLSLEWNNRVLSSSGMFFNGFTPSFSLTNNVNVLTFTSNNGSVSLYNGNVRTTYTSIQTSDLNLGVFGASQTGIGVGYTIYDIKIYNRTLSDFEINQNFNAIRARYNI
jgi:hypothetical protein